MLEHPPGPAPTDRRPGAERVPHPARVGGVKVMVVADAPWVSNRVRAALGGRAEIWEITDPGQIERMESPVADAVIVDMQVGSMGGMAVIRALKGETPAGTPIIQLLDRSADEFLARRAGADAWLLKPFTARQLRSALEEASQVGAQG